MPLSHSNSATTPRRSGSPPPVASTSQSVPVSPEDILIAEKSTRIREWIRKRLLELEAQNERLREQNLRCTNELKALASFAENTRQWRKSALFSQSISGTLEGMNRTSDDSGLTSDDMSGDRCALMSQSTSSALPKRSPRRLDPSVSMAVGASTIEHHSSNDASPIEEQKPIPTPRKVRPIMGGQMIFVQKSQKTMDRDSLNSDDYEDYEEEAEEEIFDEIIPSPIEPKVRQRNQRNPNYVNLSEFCVIRDGTENTENGRISVPCLYSEIGRLEAPEPPKHKPFMNWEQKLYRTAEKCLSVLESNGSSSPSDGLRNSERSSFGALRRVSPALLWKTPSECSTPIRIPKQSSPPNRDSDSGLGRASGLVSESPIDPVGMSRTHAPAPVAGSHSDDYALPPDAAFSPKSLPRSRETIILSSSNCSPMHLPPPSIRTSLVPSNETYERMGYLTQMSDSRLRSLKRRYAVLRDDRLDFHRTAKNQLKNDPPTLSVPIGGIQSLTRVVSRTGQSGIQIITENETLRYHAETELSTSEWFSALNSALKQLTIAELSQRQNVDSTLSGWVTKTQNGHQRRYFAALLAHKLLFFKKPDDKIPCAQMLLPGSRVSEKPADEYSGSSDEANGCAASGSGSQIPHPVYSLCIEGTNSDPLYLMVASEEEKDKWLFYLQRAAKDATVCGTPFEVLIQRLMSEQNPNESRLWKDVLLSKVESRPTEPLTTIETESGRRKAVDMDVAIHLFVSVLMRPIAIQYHVDLSQNLLTTALADFGLQNELFAQLIWLTCSEEPFSLQAWKLMAMAIPLYLPRQYSILWLLKAHLRRWKKESSRMAEFCEQLIEKRQKAGDRHEGPSKLEALSVLTRDPSSTTLPFSIPIQLPSGDFQVIEFDGSTEIGQCLSSICLKLSLRPALLSGYALYSADPLNGSFQLLKNKQKLCDCLTAWERRVKDAQCGRITDDSCSIRLHLRLRHHWTALADEETPMEKIFLCYRMAEEIVEGRVPVSAELSEELCALFAQMSHGDFPQPSLDRLLHRFYPRRMLEVCNERSVRSNVENHWSQLKGLSLAECVRMILGVLRRWRFFGAFLRPARLRLHDQSILIALTDQGIHLLSDTQLDLIRSFPYHRLVNFGEFQGDFMLTVSRILPPNSHPEETPRERLTFQMDKDSIEQLTIHLAEYIRCQKLVWKLSIR